MQCQVMHAGRMEYGVALALQDRLVADRQAGTRPDALLLLEHEPVITLGRGGDRAHLRASADVLGARRVAVYDSPRGGDITFHGPGQLVGYPILALPRERRDVRAYVSAVEEVILRTLADFGIEASRVAGLRGLWVGDAKVAAIGVRLSRWVTSHGFALNVSTDLSYFDLIVPCGLVGRSVTSMEQLLGRPVALTEVEPRVVHHFGAVFGLEMVHPEESPDGDSSDVLSVRTDSRPG